MNNFPEIGQTVLNFIGGKWEPATSDKWTDRHDPADQSILVARAPDSSDEDARLAIGAASKASTEWSALAAPGRGRLLFEWLRWMANRTLSFRPKSER